MGRKKQWTTVLTQYVDEIKEAIDYHGMTFEYVADKADLCPQTVSRLYNGITKYPAFKTVYGMCKATGFNMALVRADVKKRLAA